MHSTNVYIVDDHPMVVEGIVSFLQKEENIKVAGWANSVEACTDFFKNNTADVILMDINLPDGTGIDLCKEIKKNYPGIEVIALSTISQGSYITKMIENGASGYLLKNAEKNEILEAIIEVQKGKTYFSFEVGKIYKATTEQQNHSPILSKREKEILSLITDGLTNIEISKKLFISLDTVDTHRKNLYTKLKVTNTALLIRKAIENNFISITQ